MFIHLNKINISLLLYDVTLSGFRISADADRWPEGTVSWATSDTFTPLFPNNHDLWFCLSKSATQRSPGDAPALSLLKMAATHPRSVATVLFSAVTKTGIARVHHRGRVLSPCPSGLHPTLGHLRPGQSIPCQLGHLCPCSFSLKNLKLTFPCLYDLV